MPFEMVFKGVHSRWCPFRMVFICDHVYIQDCVLQDCVHSGNCPDILQKVHYRNDEVKTLRESHFKYRMYWKDEDTENGGAG